MFPSEQFEGLRAYHRAKFRENPRAWFRMAVFLDYKYRWWWILELLNEYGGSGVARGKKQPGPAAKSGGRAWTEFIDIPLDGVDWSHINEAFGTADKLDDAMARLLEGQYRVGFTYNSQTDMVQVSLTCRDEESPNSGCTLNSWADSWASALAVACYKHFVVAETLWRNAAGGVTRPAFG